MYISRIILKNWKNFKDVNVPLLERVFVVGPNASGKSNFLDVFRFLRDLAKPGGGLQKAVSDRGGITKIRCLAEKSATDIEIEVHISDYGKTDPLWKYAIGFKQESNGHRQLALTFEKVWKDNNLILSRPDAEDLIDKQRLTQTSLEQISANKDFREINNYFINTSYLHLVPQLLRHPQSFSAFDWQDDPYGKTFLNRLSKVNEKTRKTWLLKIQTALKIAVPQFGELKYVEEDGKPHLEATYEHIHPKSGRQFEDQLSDGTLRLIALLWSLLDGDGLLLLEEPELSLNAAINTRIPSLIYKLQKPKKRQVFVATHSPEILSDRGISLDEILLLEPASEGTRIQVAGDINEMKLLVDGGLTPGDAVLPSINPVNISQLTYSI